MFESNQEFLIGIDIPRNEAKNVLTDYFVTRRRRDQNDARRGTFSQRASARGHTQQKRDGKLPIVTLWSIT